LIQSAAEIYDKGYGRLMVAFDIGNPAQIVGYQYITATSISHNVVNAGKVKGVGDIPVVQLLMLGVSNTYKRMGIGSALFYRGLSAASQAERFIGIHGVYFESLPDALPFYTRKLGLEPKTPSGRTFYLTIPEIRTYLTVAGYAI
jgi:hypothetical protein